MESQTAPEQSKNFEKNEAKRLAKEAKFQAKLAKQKEAAEKLAKKDSSIKKKDKLNKSAELEAEIQNWKTLNEKLSDEMPSSYQSQLVESHWYQYWKSAGHYTSNPSSKKPKYVIAIPPPNITGTLHIGHALTIAIQDCLIRYHRMKGFETLYIPGCDHAGISCQIVVEKKLFKEQGLGKHDVGREKLIEMIWDWKHQFGERIFSQLERLGGSLDWTRTKFTLDPDLSEAVEEAFIRFFEDGVIYRDCKLVNWCVRLNTTLSNLEVESMELQGPTMLKVPGYDKEVEFGVLHLFSYELIISEKCPEGGKLVVATTRIETMLGDVAVAVHPDDPRYKQYHGCFLKHPFVDRQIPIICDKEAVDMSFGTGCVKITPAHDFNDYEVGKRHKLEMINIFNDDGTLNENGGEFKGVKRFDARIKVIERLKELNLYTEKKSNPMVIPVCVKSGDIIEPLLKPQWWVNCQLLAPPALEAVRNGDLEILPKTANKQWFSWLENVHDWCISRQLWWGHRVPAYQICFEDCDDGKEYWVAAKSLEEAQKKAEIKFPGKKFHLKRDEDVLDTWFSSGLWPFSTLGWPNQTLDLDAFYPTNLLETGWDILFFWVARMVMMGLRLTNKLPFKQVFCHGMVRDAHGRKMSKSLGNVIDPVDVIEGISLENLNAKLLKGNLDSREVAKATEGQKLDFPNGIPECGTDALRFALCSYTTGNLSLNLDILRVEGYRKFCNKLWNVIRFSLQKLPKGFKPVEYPNGEPLNSVERWIFFKLNLAIQQFESNLKDFNFMNAANSLYNFWLYEFCDVFVEAIKPLLDPSIDEQSKLSVQTTLFRCLDYGLRLLHPLMPYLTEELYHRLYHHISHEVPRKDSIAIEEFPKEEAVLAKDGNWFEQIVKTSKSARSAMAEFSIIKGANFIISSKATHDLKNNILVLKALIKGCDSISFGDQVKGYWKVETNSEISLFLDLNNVDLEKEIQKRQIKLDSMNNGIVTEDIAGQISTLEKEISNLNLI